MGRLLAAGLVAVAAGCTASDDPGRYYPPEDRARRALDAALTAWQQGVPPGTVMSRIHRGRECLKDLLVRRVSSDAEESPPGAGKRAASGTDETP